MSNDRRLTDKALIKALRSCSVGDCTNCPVKHVGCNALDEKAALRLEELLTENRSLRGILQNAIRRLTKDPNK